MVDQLCFRALSHQHEAARLSSTRMQDMAMELLNLEKAQTMMQHAHNMAKKHSAARRADVERMIDKVKHSLADATNENNLIYNVSPSTLDNLRESNMPQPVKGRDMVALKMKSLGNPLNNPSAFGLDAAQAEPFLGWIVPTDYRISTDKLLLERGEQINKILQEMRAQTDKASHVLETVSPQLESLRAQLGSGGGGIPVALRAEIEKVRTVMYKGADVQKALEERFKASCDVRDEHMRVLQDARGLLDRQPKLDKDLALKLGAEALSWQAAGKNVQYQDLVKLVHELRDKVDKARIGEGIARQRLADGAKELALLSLPLAQIEEEVAGSRAGGAGQGQAGPGQAGQGVQQLESMAGLVSAARSMLEERVALRTKLEALQVAVCV